MYDRTVGGQVNSFGVSGKLIRNTLVMYDRNTESLWTQILGEAIEGPLTGTKLAFVPSVHTTWADWKRQHPDTVALVKGYSGNYDSYTSYYRSGSAGVIGEEVQDDRLYTKEFVVGVAQGDEAVAYPFSALNAEPVVNDTVGGLPLLVLFNPDAGSALVFDRRLAGQTLTFRLEEPGVLADEQGGSRWDAGSGQALDGPYAGQSLERVKSTLVFWFGWKDWYQDTRVYGQEP